MKILTVVGNRPQFIKAAAVSRHLRAGAEEVIVDTGQHYDAELSQLFFDELELPAAARSLGVGSGSHAEQTARTLIALEPLLDEIGPDAVLVYGDTNATLGGALTAAKAGVPLAHVEAGMRSFDLSTPEEVNRVVTDRLAGLLLCSTPTAIENLEAEGLGERAKLVGDVMADVALIFGELAARRSDALDRLGLEQGGYVLVTAHRAENVDDPARLEQLVAVVEALAASAPVVYPLHPRTASRLGASGVAALERAGVRVTAPLGYLDLTRLLHGARALATDSGGLQKEAYLAGVPCVTLRPVTEWVETVESGWNRTVDLDPAAAAEALTRMQALREGPAPDPEIYGGGKAGERVVGALRDWLA